MIISSADRQQLHNKRLEILQALDVGDPAGEIDRLLDECRIETSIFIDLWDNRKDLVLGPKGAGKSSLYTFVTRTLKALLLKERRTIVIRGVAKVGAPIYTDYWQDFVTFTDEDFRNFWNVLFVNLVYREFIKDKNAFDVTKVSEFEKFCKESDVYLGQPENDAGLVRSVIERVRKFSAKGQGSPVGGSGSIDIELTPKGEIGKSGLHRPASVRTRAILDYINNYLEYYDLNIWITMDQLDQAFERYSDIEKRALHALISEVISFNTERLKLKVFLRDDIFELISRYKGIVNVDHLRVSDSLRWEEIDLLKLVLKRLLHNRPLLECFANISNVEAVDKLDRENCLDVFYCLFPAKGGKGADTWDYLMREMRDGNSLVTPRDFIIFLDKARSIQLKLITAGEGEATLFSKKSVESALDQTSAYKVTSYINSEFPYLQEALDKLKFQWNKYDENQLSELLGKKDFKHRLAQLFSVGVLHRKKESDTIWVAPLYQRGLEVRKRRTKKGPQNGAAGI